MTTVGLLDPVWKSFIHNVFEEELSKETQTLGDIDMDVEKVNQNLYTIDFTFDEIRLRYSAFLNLAVEESDHEISSEVESEKQHSHEENRSHKRSSIEATLETLKQKEIEEEVHELNELKNSSIETVYQDFNYWKPQVDINLEDILTEINN